MLISVENMVYNGIDLSEEFNDESDIQNRYFIINQVAGRDSYSPELTVLSATLVDGGYTSHRRLRPRYIDVILTLKGKSYDDMHKRVERLIEVLNSDGEDVPITFDDEVGRTYYGQVTSMTELEARSKVLKLALVITCTDPYKYGDEDEKLLDDEGNITNTGRAVTKPIFELDVKKKTTFAMVTSGDEKYNLIGKPTEVSEKLIDYSTVILDETGDTLSSWSIASGYNGSFSSNSSGIYVTNYGSGSEWHGAGLEKEIDATQDFEIEFYFYVRTEQPSQAFRVSLNYYDENVKELGMIRLWDNLTTRIAKIIEARLGEYTGVTHENYLISSRNYKWDNQRVYNGIIRVTRIGNTITVYAAHITQRGNHIEYIKESYNDRNNEFMGRLKFIRISAEIYGNNPAPNELSINKVKVSRINTVLEDQTPYILYPGDKVILDHVNREILVNGEERSDLLNFGSSFFDLHKGVNTLTISPEDTFDSKVSYTEKFL